MTRSRVKQRPTIYRIRIVLSGSEPEIWRVLEVPSSTTLFDMHFLIQEAMPWANIHQHMFERGDNLYVPDAADWNHLPFVGRRDALQEQDYTLAKVYGSRGRYIRYEYDLGDSWSHNLWLEGEVKAKRGVAYPRLVDGARAAPEEDFGGMWRWNEYIYELADDLSDDDFDPEDFGEVPRPLADARTFDWPAPPEEDEAEFNEPALDVKWAFEELLLSEDGISPGVFAIIEKSIDDADVEGRLLEMLRDEDLLRSQSRAPGYAAEILALLKRPSAVGALIEILCIENDLSPIVMTTITVALRHLESIALDDMIAAADSAPSPGRARLLKTLSRCQARDPRVLPLLWEWLQNSPREDSLPLQALGDWGGDDVAELLLPELDRAIAELYAIAPKDVIPSDPVVLQEARLAADYAQRIELAIQSAGGEVTEEHNEALYHAECIEFGGTFDGHSSPFGTPMPSFAAPVQPYVASTAPGRNDPCPCGSGKKYKKCCLR